MSTTDAEAAVPVVEHTGLPISTIAGTGTAGFAGDDEAAVSAQFRNPGGIAVDSDGTLYVSDFENHRIRAITPDGRISTFTGTGVAQYRGESAPAAVATLNGPRGVAVDSEGTLYLADTNSHVIRHVPAQGPGTRRVLKVAGSTVPSPSGPGPGGFSGDGGEATAAKLNRPFGVAVDRAGVVYFADTGNHRVRKVTADGKISTLAGTGSAGFSGDDGPGTSAQLNLPHGVAVDDDGNVYIADARNHRVRKVTADGKISTLAGTGSAGFGGDDGPATAARLNRPMGVAVDSTGVLYVADYENHRVRAVTSDGRIGTVAGTGDAGFDGDGGPAAAARLNHPLGLALDAEGALYIADAGNHRVRKIAPVASRLPESGTVVSWTNVRSKLRIGVLRESTKDGAEIHQSLPSRREHQRWQLVAAGQDGGDIVYTIENVRSGKVLEVVGAQERTGAVAVQRAYEGDDAHHQQWKLVPVGPEDGTEQVYKVVNRWCGQPLSADTNARTVLRTHQDEGDNRNRLWQLLPV